MGLAGVGEGERESGFVAAGMIYRFRVTWYQSRDILVLAVRVAFHSSQLCLLDNTLISHVITRFARGPHFPAVTHEYWLREFRKIRLSESRRAEPKCSACPA